MSARTFPAQAHPRDSASKPKRSKAGGQVVLRVTLYVKKAFGWAMSEVALGTEFMEASAACVVPATELLMGEWLASRGAEVIQHRGRYWQRTVTGFYEPVHWLAKLKQAELSRPSWHCWGYRAYLDPSAQGEANSRMPVSLLEDVGRYAIDALPSKRRSDLRKSEKLVTFIKLNNNKILMEQGCEVDQSAYQRTGYGAPPHQEDYRAEDYSEMPFRIVLAGMIGRDLGGYLTAYAVDEVAYIHKISLATRHLKSAIGTGLVLNFVRLCQRSPGIKKIVYGLHSIEDPPLVAFKEGLGFATVLLPSYVWMLPGMRKLIELNRPYAHYRLTGATLKIPGIG